MRILITGTSRGIGLATALKFLDEGHDVIGIDVLPSTINNVNYTHIVRDLREKLPELQQIDILINNAGTAVEEDAIEVNLLSAIKVTEKYEKSANLKSIVFVVSASATTGAEFPYYTASKGGLLSYMKNTALRLAPRGVTVNAVSPGAVITDMNDHILKDRNLYEAVANEAMLKKWATAEEIADWIYFLAITNKSMTGQDLLIDNGEALNSNFIW